MSTMSTYESRLSSYAPRKPKTSKKSALNTHLAKGWPHPVPTGASNENASYKADPSSLAHAGFYFDPTSDKSDNVTCFTCEHSLAEWTAEDDPFSAHLEVNPSCAWALARCSIELDRTRQGGFQFTDASRLPTSKGMEKARVETFKGNWIHDQSKGHTANSRKMAKAGWIYNPSQVADGEWSDIATCFYCGKSLDGWEMGDDPTKEHKSRVPNCPMFTAKLTEPEPEPVPSKSQATLAPPVNEGRPPVSVISIASTTVTTKTTKSTRGKKAKPAPAEPTTATEVEESDAPSQPKKGRPKKSKKEVEMVSASEEVVPSSSQGRSKRGTKAPSVAPSVQEEEMEEPPAKRETKKGRGKSKKFVPAEAVSASEYESAVAEQEEETIKLPIKKTASKTTKAAKKGGKGRAASVTSDMEVDTQPVEEEEIVPLKKTSKSVEPTFAKTILEPTKPKDSIGGWTSFDAANAELEEMAVELGVEGEFRAIGGAKSSSSADKKSTSSKTAPAKPTKEPKASSSRSKSTKAKKTKGEDDKWAYRSQSVATETEFDGKSVDTRSVATDTEVATEPDMEVEGTELTKEEEVERSLAGDSEEEAPAPPSSRGKGTAGKPNPFQTAGGSTKPKTKAKDVKMQKVASALEKARVFEDEEMVDMTPKAARSISAKGASNSAAPAAIFADTQSASNVPHSFNSSGPALPASLASLLSAPTVPTDRSVYELTEEEKEMTLEEWIRYDVERRKEEIRKEGRKWIGGFLEGAEEVRERIRAL